MHKYGWMYEDKHRTYLCIFDTFRHLAALLGEQFVEG